jgi:thiol-disulfide isomerase/thioredoxin
MSAMLLHPDLLVAAMAGLVTFGIALRAARSERRELLRLVAWTMLGMAVAARAIFVWQNHVGYLQEPVELLKLWDGGWDLQSGVLAGWMGALVATRERPATRKRLAGVLAVGTTTWIVASVAVLFMPGHEAVALENLSATDQDGAQIRFHAFQGKPTVVNLWATWCPPCQRELPLLKDAQARLVDTHVVLVNQGETVSTARDFLNRRGLVFRTSLFDQRGQVKLKLSPAALPATYLFDASGRLVDVHIGELTDESLRALLGRIANPGKQ